MEEEGMEIQFLVTWPTNVANIYEILGGTFDYYDSHLMGYELDAFNGDGAKAVQKIFADHDMEDYLEPSMLGCFSAPWRCGRRGTRMRRRSPWRVEIGKLFGHQYPCTSGRGKCGSRKNNDHWSEDEMIELVDGVSKTGIGKWSRLKQDYFSSSIRTAIHLKDKWRNLVIACKAKYATKKARKAKNITTKKVNVQKTTDLIVERLGHQILAMEASKRLAQKKK